MSLSSGLASFSDLLDRAVTLICVGCILVMLGISFAGFTYMIMTGAALSWTYSLARLFIPALGLLSITVAFKRGEHIAMASLQQLMPARVIRFLRAVNRAVAALFAGLLIWYGILYVMSSTDYYMVSDQIQIHARWVVTVIPLTGVVLLIHVLSGSNLFDAPDLLEPEIVAPGPVQRKPGT